MIFVTLDDVYEDCGFDSEFETAIERHDTKWYRFHKTFKFESVTLTLEYSRHETDINCYDENEAVGGYGPSMSNYGVEINEYYTLTLLGRINRLSFDKRNQRHMAFFNDLMAIEGSGGIVFPFDIYMEISDYRMKRLFVLIDRK